MRDAHVLVDVPWLEVDNLKETCVVRAEYSDTRDKSCLLLFLTVAGVMFSVPHDPSVL